MRATSTTINVLGIFSSSIAGHRRHMYRQSRRQVRARRKRQRPGFLRCHHLPRRRSHASRRCRQHLLILLSHVPASTSPTMFGTPSVSTSSESRPLRDPMAATELPKILNVTHDILKGRPSLSRLLDHVVVLIFRFRPRRVLLRIAVHLLFVPLFYAFSLLDLLSRFRFYLQWSGSPGCSASWANVAACVTTGTASPISRSESRASFRP